METRFLEAGKNTESKIILCTLLSLTLGTHVFAADSWMNTVAGHLSASRVNDICYLSLNCKAILSLDCTGSYLPGYVKTFYSKIGQFDQVVVLQELPKGNACNGGPLYLVGLRHGKSAKVFGPIDFCGGRAPTYHHSKDSITITLPG